jgi:hypothetical protein
MCAVSALILFPYLGLLSSRNLNPPFPPIELFPLLKSKAMGASSPAMMMSLQAVVACVPSPSSLISVLLDPLSAYVRKIYLKCGTLDL